MHIRIDPNSDVPIYEQLVRQVKYAVADGVVVAGQVIPSVREMAKSLALNPNTVQRAYLQLQAEEVLQSLRGRGMRVTAGARRKCVADRQHLVAGRLQSALQEAVSSGLAEDDLRQLCESSLKQALRQRT